MPLATCVDTRHSWQSSYFDMPRNKKKVHKDDAACNAGAVDGNVTEATIEVSGCLQKQPNIGLSVVLRKGDLTELSKQSADPTLLWGRIRNELQLSTQDFYAPRKATLVWARERGNTKSRRAVLVSFYSDNLDEYTGQLSFKALFEPGEPSGNSVLITHWPKSAKSLKPDRKYCSNASRENGFEPDWYTPKELIEKFVGAFMKQPETGEEQLNNNEEKLCERFFGSFDPPLTANSDEDRDQPAVIYLENVIETDDEETNVHMFTYKRKLDVFRGDNFISNSIGRLSIFMHWGVIFKFEKQRGDVYWTLDGGHKMGKLCASSNYFVRAHRALPGDIDTKKVECDDGRTAKKPRITYHGFVRSSRREIIRIAKRLQPDRFSGRHAWISQNSQEWAADLLALITSMFDRFWFGPKTLKSRYYDEFGKKLEIPSGKRKKKAREERMSNERSTEIELVGGHNGEGRLKVGSLETLKELLTDIRTNYDIDEDKFNERRPTELYKLEREIPCVLVKFVGQMVEESYLIHSQKDSLSITRFPTDPGLVMPAGFKANVKTGLSTRALFEWCVRMHRWLVVSEEKKQREYSSERFVKKLIDSLGPIPLSQTA